MGIFGRSGEEDEPPSGRKLAPHERPGGEFLKYQADYQAQIREAEAPRTPTPNERAVEAFNRGDRFLQIELPYATISAEAGMWIYPVSQGDIHRTADAA